MSPQDAKPHGSPKSHRKEIAEELLRAHPEFEEPHLLEVDETVPPRPEEEIADADR